MNVKTEVINQLRQHLLSLEGSKPHLSPRSLLDVGLPLISKAFSGACFPVGVVHELVSAASANAAATNGFLAGLLRALMGSEGMAIWVSNCRQLAPIGLCSFLPRPDQCIFIDVSTDTEVLWVVEQCLKCEALSAVVGELRDVSFLESQRLQLAVERSGVTGFLHRHHPRSTQRLACYTKWEVAGLASVVEEGMPGIGHPRWEVTLSKVRNGKPGKWILEWNGHSFQMANAPNSAISNIIGAVYG